MQFPTHFASDKVHMMMVDYEDGTVGVHQFASTGPRNMNSQVTLTEAEARHLIASLEAWLTERNPAYIAHMERAAAAGEPALPATDDEWKARLVEGGVA